MEEFRGTAHWECNIGYKVDRNVNVFFHNLRKYDGHLIMQEIGGLCQRLGGRIECVPKGTEDYLSFGIKLKHHVVTPERRRPSEFLAALFHNATEPNFEPHLTKAWKITTART